MTDAQLAIVVLAAGQGTRMKSSTPKLLHKLGGVSVVSHVLATARELNAAHVVSVVRHERDRLVEVIEVDLPESIIVDQDEVPGTGRAVELAVAALPAGFAGDVLVVNGDVPLLDAETLQGLINQHRDAQAAATVLSTILDDATGYGRVIRSVDGNLEKLVEHKDANQDELAIKEINAGIYVFSAPELRAQLSNLTLDNAQGEKYITDVIGLLRQAGATVAAVEILDSWKVEGINDRAQLSRAAGLLNGLIVRGWQLAGVTITDPASTWIDIQ
ncbi:MAG: NTP transferase domain-containing protein, partial [Aurantimicrobium sp.]